MFRRAVTPVAITAATQTRCIYEYKFGQTPLTRPFKIPGHRIQRLPGSSPAVVTQAGKIEVTKLHNGARVISQDMGGPMVSVGAYILAGPAYDPQTCPGVAGLMHLALTTSNYNNSLFQLDRNIRSVGAAESHFEKYKHYIGIRIDARSDMWKRNANTKTPKHHDAHSSVGHQHDINLVQDNIFTCLAAPRFHETDIERFRDTIDNQLKELRWQYPAEYAVQMLETVAFYREALGNPRFVPENNNSNITSKVLLDHYSRYIIPSRIVIAGVNVSHAALIAEYENTPYPHSESAPHHAKVLAETQGKSRLAISEMKQYTGGERHDHEDRAKEMGTKPDMDTESICAVGWLAYGRDKKSIKDYAASMVTRSLIDMEFADGARYNRDETHLHEDVRTFYNPYQTAGLMGFTVTAEPESVVKKVTDTVKRFQSMKNASQATLDVAKLRATTRFLNESTDTIRDYCDYLGTSLDAEGGSTTHTSIEDVLDAIKAVGSADIKKVHDTMFSHPTSLYAHGEVMGFPSLRQMGL